MKLEDYVSQYSLDEIITIEYGDMQLIVIEKARKEISKLYGTSDFIKNTFLELIIQNSLVSFQIGGTGQDWWNEFTQLLKDSLLFQDNSIDRGDWWKITLEKSRYNRRLGELKLGRIQKYLNNNSLLYSKSFEDWYGDMDGFNMTIAIIMKQKKDDKTIVFTTKMFGYASRIVYEKFILFPNSVGIPVDSRLHKIYKNENQFFGENLNFKKVFGYYLDLSKKFEIPPLHLDSLIWIKYWKDFYSGGQYNNM